MRNVMQRRSFEVRSQRQLHGHSRMNQGLDPDQRQGVAAQFEEVVVTADAFDTQNLAPDLRERCLNVSPRRLMEATVGILGLRQSLAIELPIRVQRQSFEYDERTGHHVLRQYPRQAFAE